MKSFKQMIQAGEVKRADAMKVQPQDLHEEPGFNLRIEDAEFQSSIDALAAYIVDGGVYPPLEVRPREEGGVWIVDGHRRRRAILQAIEKGAPIEWVNVVAFTGNDADRTLRVITSAEGRNLSPLETALGYKRLRSFDWTPDQIAAKVGKTVQHVHHLLILADAPAKVHRMVAAGEVSAAVAVDMVRKHGDKAGEVLGGELDKAKAGGKGKVTAGTVKGKALPPKVVAPLVDATDALVDALTAQEHQVLTAIRNGTTSTDTIMVSGRALLALIDAQTAIIDVRAKQKDRAGAKAAKAKQTNITEAA